MKKCMNFIEKFFFVQKMDVRRNEILHQILNDRHNGTFFKNQKKRVIGGSSKLGSCSATFEAWLLQY